MQNFCIEVRPELLVYIERPRGSYYLKTIRYTTIIFYDAIAGESIVPLPNMRVFISLIYTHLDFSPKKDIARRRPLKATKPQYINTGIIDLDFYCLTAGCLSLLVKRIKIAVAIATV